MHREGLVKDADNPMEGYMNEVIFSRMIGHNEILIGEQWKDCSQCWICEKWSKEIIVFNYKDEKIMEQGIQNL